jgi:hypothetical protein
MRRNIIAIQRDAGFSPNSVDRDRAILQAVAAGLEGDVSVVTEQELAACSSAHVYLSMARSPQALALLERREREGALVINSTRGVRACSRKTIDGLMRRCGIPMPPPYTAGSCWLKRGEGYVQSQDDVVFCRNEAELAAARRGFRARGIGETVVSTHVAGDVIKFYGVAGGFFRYFYPADDGLSKFGNERHNGRAHHYPFAAEDLQRDVQRLARLAQVEVYGGDAIVSADGSYYLIDFNDWPSFSPCFQEAARAIVHLINSKMHHERFQATLTQLF